MALQVLKVTAVVLADIEEAQAFGKAIQHVLAQAAKEHDASARFRGNHPPAVTILAATNSVVPASKELATRYIELEQRANEAIAVAAER